MLDTPLKIECIKVNKYSEESGEKKGVFFYAVSFLNKFRVYFARLELLIEGYLDNDQDVFKSIEFGV